MKTQRKFFDPICVTVLTLLIVLIGAIQTAFAQESRGTIIGRVADSTGAAVAGVKVDIVNMATNVTTSATTNEEGRFSAPFLLPGAYRVTAEKTGFKRFVQTGVEVRVSETVELNIAHASRGSQRSDRDRRRHAASRHRGLFARAGD